MPFRSVGYSRPNRLAPFFPRAGAFSPLNISGILAWYDFSDISTLYQDSAKTTPVTSDGDPIGAAENKANPGTIDATQTTAANKPTYKTGIQNGKSAGLGDGGDSLSTGAFSGGDQSQPGTVFLVISNPGTTSQEIPFDGFFSTKRWVPAYLQGNQDDTIRWFAGTDTDSNVSMPADGTAIYTTTIINGASSILRRNGSQIHTANIGAHALNGITIFSDYVADGGIGNWSGYIMEVIVYSGALSAGNISDVETYLSGKWGI